MAETKMTKTQIINETFNFYKANPSLRGKNPKGNPETCMYNGGDGRHCAVGRCLSAKYKKMGADLEGNQNVITDLIELNKVENLDEMLIPRYRGHSKEFWRNMQRVHDASKFWNEEGLTEEGIKNLNELKESYHGL